MSHCLQLLRNEEAVPFVTIDEELCTMMGVEVHPTEWVAHWYNALGQSMAAGCSFEELREIWEDNETLLTIIDYLEEQFTISAWRER